MVHLSEESQRLSITQPAIQTVQAVLGCAHDFDGVLVLRLPACKPDQYAAPLDGAPQIIHDVAARLGMRATLVVIGDVIDLVHTHTSLADVAHFHHWIAIRRKTPQDSDSIGLPHNHFGALIYSRYTGSLHHTRTRLQYTYCPACDKTTKDYGGKKHTYHHYGTLLSDVWRDYSDDLDGDLLPTLIRVAVIPSLQSHAMNGSAASP